MSAGFEAHWKHTKSTPEVKHIENEMLSWYDEFIVYSHIRLCTKVAFGSIRGIIMENLFAKRLKILRLSHRLTQEQIANYLGTSRQAIANYERGKRECGIDSLILLADLFGVSVDYLIGHSDIRY